MICPALQAAGLSPDQLTAGARFAEPSLFDSIPIQQARHVGREVYLGRIAAELSNSPAPPVASPYHAITERDLRDTYWRAVAAEREDYFSWLNAIVTATRPL